MKPLNLIPFSAFGHLTKKIARPVVTKKCVVYTRVSSKEQAMKNLSLTTQLKAIEEFAKRTNMEIASVATS